MTEAPAGPAGPIESLQERNDTQLQTIQALKLEVRNLNDKLRKYEDDAKAWREVALALAKTID